MHSSRQLNTKPRHDTSNGIPTVQQSKILEVVFDNVLRFPAHASYINERNRVQKTLAGTTWGKHKAIMQLQFESRFSVIDSGTSNRQSKPMHCE